MPKPHEQRPVVWTRRAIQDLEVIRLYLEAINPLALQRLTRRIITTADTLADYPVRYRSAGRIRELVIVRPYVIRYRVETEQVLILRVRHGARRPLSSRPKASKS